LYQLTQKLYLMKTATLEKKTGSAKAKHPHELIRRIQKGLPFSELKALQDKIDVPLEQLAGKLSLSRSTLQRRKATGRLSPDESDKVMRFTRLLGHAADVFGNIDKARAWLKHPQRGLGGAVPLDYARTEVGAREVENLLGRIDYGVYS
jgi:putative toxin-antitoxin system antitoxin component (TIGR02293 family)